LGGASGKTIQTFVEEIGKIAFLSTISQTWNGFDRLPSD
jgi:hypothetical protein